MLQAVEVFVFGKPVVDCCSSCDSSETAALALGVPSNAVLSPRSPVAGVCEVQALTLKINRVKGERAKGGVINQMV